MKKIPLTQGKYALVDDADYEWLNQWTWCSGARGYAYRGVGTKTSPRIYMHRLIMNAPQNKEVDHIDGDGFNNQQSNLRLCSRLENSRNIHTLNAKSGFKGVHKTVGGKWWATITHNKKTYYLGTYPTKEQAAQVYNEAAKNLHKRFANLNKLNKTVRVQKIIRGGKLTSEDVYEIRALIKKGVKTREIMNRFNLTQPAIWKIKNGISHAEV